MNNYSGKRLDSRYEIKELIGIGGMALVYRAYDIIDDRIVAIKILKDEYLGDSEFIRRFKNESKAIAILSHPNIVHVYDVSFGDRIQYIVMEYMDGITLKDYINQQKEIKWKEAVYFTSQILKALSHAHKRGVIHKDIKPQNIMLLPDGTIKVTDFGIARFSRNETRTMTDRAIGSVHYIAPEQARGDVVTQQADIYSVGVMLYEMLTGRLPFEADNAVSVAIMQLQTVPVSPREIKSDIPEGLEEIVLKAMQKETINRYASADSMLSDIEKFKENPSIKFEYRYLNDENPTKYVDIVSNIKETQKLGYGDNFDVSEESKKKKSKGPLIASIIAGVVVLFAIILSIFAFNSCSNSNAKDVEVPNFIGMNIKDVKNNPKYKFAWNIEYTYDSSKDEGYILNQSPKEGSKKVKENATIKLVVNSSGALVAIPSIKGMLENAAKSKLSEYGFSSDVMYVFNDDVALGVVVDTDPKEGSKVPIDTVVKVYISKGPKDDKVKVPDVINTSLDNAKSALEQLGLTYSIETVESEIAKNTVVFTDPLPGVVVNKGTSIKLTVSSGSWTKKETLNMALPGGEGTANVKVMVDGIQQNSDVVDLTSRRYKIDVTGKVGESKTIVVYVNDSEYYTATVSFNKTRNDVSEVYKRGDD